jgi:hypothetical protein
VAHLTNQLKSAGAISAGDKEAIQSCAARSDVGRRHGGTMSDGALAGTSTPGGLAIRFAGSNPARGGVSLELDMPARGEAEIQVHDVRGARVRMLGRQSLAPGRHVIRWDGADDAGRSVEPGVYFVRVLSREGVGSLRFVLLQ